MTHIRPETSPHPTDAPGLTRRRLLQSAAAASLLGSRALATAATSSASAGPIDGVLPAYDITWTTPSSNVGDAMPIGNGNIAAMVWAEPGGDLRLRVALNDSWDENARSIGLSNFRVALSPNPFASGQPFSQTLSYLNGKVTLTAGNNPAVTVTVWVDANQPVIHIETAGAAHSIKVSSERWRTTTQTLTTTPWSDFIHVADFDNTSPLTVKITADTVLTNQPNKIVFYHRNEYSCWGATGTTQSVSLSGIADPYTYRTTGAVVQGSGLVSSGAEALVSTTAATGFRVDIVALTQVAPDVNTFVNAILGTATSVWGTNISNLRAAHEAYWSAFWNRSYLFVTGDAQAEQVTRGWLAARYLMALQGRSEGAIEFNGGAFTLNNDSKQWHDYTLFNERFAYWSMLASGDGDLMQSYFNVMVAAIPVAKAKTQAMWGHAGLILPEHMIYGGFQSGSHYGWNRTNRAVSDIADSYTRLLYEGAPEIAVMMLDYYAYTLDQPFVTNVLLPFAKEVVIWYDKHWQRVNGKLNLQPIYSGESDRNLQGPSYEIAALKRLIGGLLALPTTLVSTSDRTYWTSMQGQLPDLPISNGRIRTSQDVELGQETNNQNLFAIFPFRLYGNGQPDRQIGIDSYLNRRGKAPQNGSQDWRHDADHAAYLGLTDEARDQTVRALTRTKYRYLGFIDGNPDGDHSIQPLAIGKIALQAMLLHPQGSTIRLFNAWPASWNVRFKLWAPQSTSVEGVYTARSLTNLTVTPAARAADVVICDLTPSVISGSAYAFLNQAAGLALDVGSGTGNTSPVYQSTVTRSDVQRWTPVQTDPGWFRIANVATGKSLAVQGASQTAGAPVVQYDYSADSTTNDEWRFVDVGNGLHQIVNRYSGLALSVPNGNVGATLTQEAPSGAPNQMFALSQSVPASPIAAGIYRITAKNTGWVVDVSGNRLDDDAPVDQAPSNGQANQKWNVQSVGNGYFRLLAVSSGRALVVLGAATGTAAIVQHAYSGDDVRNDEWWFNDVGNGWVEVINRRSGLLLSSPNTTQGAQFVQAARNPSDAQRFQFTAA